MSALSGQLTCIDLPAKITCLSALKIFSKSSAPCFPPHLAVSTAASSVCGVICPSPSHVPLLCLLLPSPCQPMQSSIHHHHCHCHLSTSHQRQPLAPAAHSCGKCAYWQPIAQGTAQCSCVCCILECAPAALPPCHAHFQGFQYTGRYV